MGSISGPSYPGSGGTEDAKFIRCIEGWEPQIHKLWCLCLENITREVHAIAQVEVGAGPVREFTTNYPAENRRRIPTIGQLSINGSVQFWGIPDFVRGIGLSFIPNMQVPTDLTVWGVNWYL